MNRLVTTAAPLLIAVAVSFFCGSTSAQAAFPLESSSSNMLTRKGYDLVHSGAYTHAIEVLKHAVRANPNDMNARRYLVYALVRSEDFPTASLQLRAIARATKLTAADYYLAGTIEARLGDTKRALQEYRSALAIEPEMGAAKAGIIELFVLASDFQGATYLCKDCIDKSRNPTELTYFNKLMQSVKERERAELAQTVDPNVKATEVPAAAPASLITPVRRPLIPMIIQPPPLALPKISPIATRAKA